MASPTHVIREVVAEFTERRHLVYAEAKRCAAVRGDAAVLAAIRGKHPPPAAPAPLAASETVTVNEEVAVFAYTHALRYAVLCDDVPSARELLAAGACVRVILGEELAAAAVCRPALALEAFDDVLVAAVALGRLRMTAALLAATAPEDARANTRLLHAAVAARSEELLALVIGTAFSARAAPPLLGREEAAGEEVEA